MASVAFRMRGLPPLTEDSPFDDVQLPDAEKQLYKMLGIKTVGQFLQVDLLEGMHHLWKDELKIRTVSNLYIFEAIMNNQKPMSF